MTEILRTANKNHTSTFPINTNTVQCMLTNFGRLVTYEYDFDAANPLDDSSDFICFIMLDEQMEERHATSIDHRILEPDDIDDTFKDLYAARDKRFDQFLEDIENDECRTDEDEVKNDIVNDIKRLLPDINASMARGEIYPSMPGEPVDVLCVVKNGYGTPRSYINQMNDYIAGNVYMLRTFTPHTWTDAAGDELTTWDEDECVGDIYISFDDPDSDWTSIASEYLNEDEKLNHN